MQGLAVVSTVIAGPALPNASLIAVKSGEIPTRVDASTSPSLFFLQTFVVMLDLIPTPR
jgi:hypothetical protein